MVVSTIEFEYILSKLMPEDAICSTARVESMLCRTVCNCPTLVLACGDFDMVTNTALHVPRPSMKKKYSPPSCHNLSRRRILRDWGTRARHQNILASIRTPVTVSNAIVRRYGTIQPAPTELFTNWQSMRIPSCPGNVAVKKLVSISLCTVAAARPIAVVPTVTRIANTHHRRPQIAHVRKPRISSEQMIAAIFTHVAMEFIDTVCRNKLRIQLANPKYRAARKATRPSDIRANLQT